MDAKRELEIQALAKKYLAIPKENRLLGEDEYVQVPAVPDQFYVNEVATWLSYAREFAPKNFDERKTDYVIESVGYKPINHIKFDLLNSKPGLYLETEDPSITRIEIYHPLVKGQISRLDLTNEELVNHSYSHHHFLSRVIRRLYENPNAFISALALKFQLPLRGGKHYFNDSLHLLRKINLDLSQLEEEGQYGIVPRLFALRDQGRLMASDLNEVFKYEVEEWGLQYSYGFSQETSYHFLKIMQTFITRQIDKYEWLLSNSSEPTSKEAPVTLNESKWMLVPSDYRGKWKAIRKILELSEDNMEDANLRIDPFQIMILLRAFQETGMIKKKIDKGEFALAYQILTGGSASYFELQYKTEELTAVNLKKICKIRQAKKAKAQIILLKDLLGKDVINYLSNLERIV